jgi:outer membrane protein TolC
MVMRDRSESVRLSSGGAFGITKPCILMLLVFTMTESRAQVVSPNYGSVPSGTATNEVLRLTLSEAINRAVRYNLGAIESEENTRAARGQRLLALSYLLPQVSAGINENVDQVNFTALGLTAIKIPGIPAIAGPFSYSTASANLSQTLFSYESIQRFRAARTAEQAAQLSYKDTLDVITVTVGNAYLEVIEAHSRIEAEEAQVQNAKALYDQAVDEFQAGTSPRIDVTRTAVQLHTEEYNLSVARNNFEVAKLTLGRAIGLPLGQVFDIADQLPYADINPPTVEEALKMAYNSRTDFRSALNSAKSAEQALSAAKGERYPVVAVNGDYGDQGKAEAENIRGQIDYDVRTAFLNLNAAKEQVDVAHQNVDLANDNVARSKERFAAGVTDSVEVVQSEQSLASANDQYITSLYSHNLAKLALARALGVARTNFSQYLGGH